MLYALTVGNDSAAGFAHLTPAYTHTHTHSDSPGIYWQQWAVGAISTIGPRGSLLVLLPAPFPAALVLLYVSYSIWKFVKQYGSAVV